jgi:hypothetical protein
MSLGLNGLRLVKSTPLVMLCYIWMICDISLNTITGTTGIIKKIWETVGDCPVYLSIDVRLDLTSILH